MHARGRAYPFDIINAISYGTSIFSKNTQ